MLPARRLKQETFVSHSAGGWKSKIKSPADVVPGGSSLSSFLSVHAWQRESAHALACPLE